MTSFLCTKEFEKFFSQVRLKEDIGSSLDSSIDLVLGDPRVIAFLDQDIPSCAHAILSLDLLSWSRGRGETKKQYLDLYVVEAGTP